MTVEQGTHRPWTRRSASRRWVMIAAILVAGAAQAQPGPWARTETRADCADYDANRQPYFGETHIHTTYSADSLLASIIADPRDAYRFAKGEPLGLPPFGPLGVPTGTAQLRRPLDFTAVTDHAEGFGEMDICFTPGLDGYDSPECTNARNGLLDPIPPVPGPGLPPAWVLNVLIPYAFVPNPVRFSWCGPGNANCLARASLIWEDTQDAAEEHYDRTAACTFTTFVAYEWSATPGGLNLHRNVIFRNAEVPALPISYMETQTAPGLWAGLKTQCLDAPGACDVLAIPHNPNASGGLMFQHGAPLTAVDAQTRADFEPLVEMMQHKGDSECRTGVGTTDELCGFEKLQRTTLFGASNPSQPFQSLSFARNGLKQGLLEEERLGVNPFRIGWIGSTDTHNSTPGAVEEETWKGHIGTRDATPAYRLTRYAPGGIESNPGGLAVLWAEENSRDALFAAMRRREAYATSGTRPIVRFFGGRIPAGLCKKADFAARGYADGVPMGGEIGPVQGDKSPRFAVLAQKDPGTVDVPGTPLQQVQIVKGWIDGNGVAQEAVFDVAGDPDNAATVDTTTCEPSGSGFDSLCTVWEDPQFDRTQRAFYYARVIENPTCRWSTRLCNEVGIDCSGTVPAGFDTCCDPQFPKTIQERAWTSAIWYRPEAVAKLRGKIRFGDVPNTDRLSLKVTLGSMPPEIDPATTPLTIQISDDDEIYSVTIPAGTLVAKGSGFGYDDPTGSLNGLQKVSIKTNSAGEAQLKLRTVAGLDLSNADTSSHMVRVALSSGTYRAEHERRWRSKTGLLIGK